jgi:hypothetical protein
MQINSNNQYNYNARKPAFGFLAKVNVASMQGSKTPLILDAMSTMSSLPTHNNQVFSYSLEKTIENFPNSANKLSWSDKDIHMPYLGTEMTMPAFFIASGRHVRNFLKTFIKIKDDYDAVLKAKRPLNLAQIANKHLSALMREENGAVFNIKPTQRIKHQLAIKVSNGDLFIHPKFKLVTESNLSQMPIPNHPPIREDEKGLRLIVDNTKKFED